MKKITALLNAALLAGGVSTAAIAADATGHAASESGTTSGVSMHDKDFKGAHSMTGTISKIDHEEGTLTLKTGKEELELHFPPTAITTFKEGDQATVRLGITKAGAQTSSTGSQTGTAAKKMGD